MVKIKNQSTSTKTTFWKITLIVLCLIGLSTGILRFNTFWTSYVLDIVGPAWIYILIRVQYRSKKSTFLSFNFSPEGAAFLIIGVCYIIETSQYFKIYDSWFDPYDYIAYISAIIPVFAIDKLIHKKEK